MGAVEATQSNMYERITYLDGKAGEMVLFFHFVTAVGLSGLLSILSLNLISLLPQPSRSSLVFSLQTYKADRIP
jgi:hypothetical protein